MNASSLEPSNIIQCCLMQHLLPPVVNVSLLHTKKAFWFLCPYVQGCCRAQWRNLSSCSPSILCIRVNAPISRGSTNVSASVPLWAVRAQTFTDAPPCLTNEVVLWAFTFLKGNFATYEWATVNPLRTISPTQFNLTVIMLMQQFVSNWVCKSNVQLFHSHMKNFKCRQKQIRHSH